MIGNGIIRMIKMDFRGRIVVPAEIRRMLGLASGDPIEVCFENGNITIKKPAAINAANN